MTKKSVKNTTFMNDKHDNKKDELCCKYYNDI